METKFTVGTSEINKVLLEFKKLQKKFFDTGNAKIRVMPGGIEISGQGLYKTINGETEGLSELFVPLKLLYSFSSFSKLPKITFLFRRGELHCGSSIFSLPSIKVETWYNSPDLDLCLNSDDFSILREALLKGNEHMEKHNLAENVKIANAKLINSVNDAYTSLRAFRISKNEIMDLVIAKLRNQ
jgi:hypothetical protein